MTHCPPVLHPVKLFASALLISVHLLLFFLCVSYSHTAFFLFLLHHFWLCSSSCTLFCLLRRLPFFHPLLSHHSALPLLLSFYLCIFSSTLLLFLLFSLPCLFSAAITTHSFNLLPDAEQWGGRDGGGFLTEPVCSVAQLGERTIFVLSLLSLSHSSASHFTIGVLWGQRLHSVWRQVSPLLLCG